jgi:hypothetical protein
MQSRGGRLPFQMGKYDKIEREKEIKEKRKSCWFR